MLYVAGGQTSLPQDERSEFLRAVHGGAGHPARQTSIGDGHSRVCQPAQTVGLNLSLKGAVDERG